MLGWNIVNVLLAWNKVTTEGWQTIPMALAMFLPIPTLTPRFVLSMRELYGRTIRGGGRRGIDTGFGLSTLSSSSHGLSTAIAFADSDELEYGEEIQMGKRNRVTSPSLVDVVVFASNSGTDNVVAAQV